MAALTGNKIKDSYLGLLKSIDNAPFSPRAAGTFVQISDGGGNSLPLYLAVNAIRFYDAYTFPSADGTVDGQVLSTDANGTLSWVTSSDNQTLQEVLTQGNTTDLEITTSAQFNGDINGALLQKVKAAEVLSKGDVVYISGGTGDNPEVSKANASDSTKMPALGIMKESLNNINDEGECITSGELTGVNLTGFYTGDELFVSSTTAGGLVDTAPTGEANLIQKIGKVIKGDNGGALTVLGAFRTNAMPNLPTGIILGDTTNVVTAITDGSVGQILSTDGSGTYSFIDDNAITSAVSPLNLSANQISLGTVGVSKGGTGATTLTGILLGNGTSAISGITSADDGHVLTADGNGGYAFEVASGDVTVDGASVGNRVAVWNNTTGELRATSAIATENSNIYLVQPSTNGTDKFNYIIGGAFAINENDFGTQNTGFGHAVLNGADLTGGSNSSFGIQSQTALTTGSHNTSIGSFAMYDNRSGDYNVGLGAKTMFNQRISNNNVSIGYDSMDGVTASQTAASNNNVAIGYESLHIIEGGDNNTVLGYQSGSAITTGSNNVIIGSNTGSTIATSSNNIIISDGSGNNRLQFGNTGNATFSHSDTGSTTDYATKIIKASTSIIGGYTGTKIISALGGYDGTIHAVDFGFGYNTTGYDLVLSTNDNTVGNPIERMRITSNGNVGINEINPVNKLEVNGLFAAPLTSGSAQNGIARFSQTLGDGVLDIGFGDPYAWLQARNSSNYATSYDLALNPNGGNVGIGTTTLVSTAQLTIKGNYHSDFIRNYTSSNRGYSLRFGAATPSSGDVIGAQIAGTLLASNNDGEIEFYTKSSGTLGERMRISSGGLATFQNGIKFGGTPSPAYDSGADTLDAYEEGTWTPSIKDSSNVAANLDSTNSVGVYTRVGNLVYFRATIQITSYPSPAPSSSSVAFIRGFPYTSATIPGNWYRPSSVITRYITFSGYLNLHVNANSDYGYLFDSVSASNGGAVEFSKYTSNSTLNISGVYEI